MPKPLSMDLRERLLAAVEAGQSRRATGRQFAVSESCVVRLMKQYATAGTIALRKFGGHMRPVLEPHYDRIRALVAAMPDITIEELRERLATDGIRVSRSPLGRCLLALGLTRKKRPGTLPNRTARTWPPRARPGAKASRR